MINDDMPSISQSVGVQKAYDKFTEYTVMGFFGRLNYDFANRYLLELNGRYDASSKFPSGSRWGFFPSLSVGWRVMEESFMEPLRDYIRNLRLEDQSVRLVIRISILTSLCQVWNLKSQNG